MPSKLIKAYAKQTGKTEEAIEKIWDDMAKKAKDSFKNESPQFWAYVNTSVRKHLGLKEDYSNKKLSLREYLDIRS